MSDDRERLGLLADMIRIRRLEEACAEMYASERIRGFLHLYIGEEACAVGVCTALDPRDALVATYREHAHALMRGMPAGVLMAEMLGVVEGCSRGRGGSMHLFDRERRLLGGNAIVGAGLPTAVGVALADRMLGRPQVTACVFGDGAVAEGAFHESLNLAALWRLPVLFVCENNGYGMGTATERALAQPRVAASAAPYGIPSQTVDGMDVEAVLAATRAALGAVRSQGTPRLLELVTYRFRAHSMYDAELYRTKEEVARWRERDPIPAMAARLESEGLLDGARHAAMTAAADDEIAGAIAFASAGTPEPVSDLLRFVHAEPGGTR